MDLNKIDILPLFIQLGKFSKKEIQNNEVKNILVSRKYQTESLKRINFNKPIIFKIL